MTSRKLVLIESDQTQIEALEPALLARGFTVVSTFDGRAAVDLILEERPDLIILAVELAARQSGYLICGKLKKSDEIRDIPVIMIGRDSDGLEAHKKLKARADDYFVKPFDPEELAAQADRLAAPMMAEIDLEPSGELLLDTDAFSETSLEQDDEFVIIPTHEAGAERAISGSRPALSQQHLLAGDSPDLELDAAFESLAEAAQNAPPAAPRRTAPFQATSSDDGIALDPVAAHAELANEAAHYTRPQMTLSLEGEGDILSGVGDAETEFAPTELSPAAMGEGSALGAMRLKRQLAVLEDELSQARESLAAVDNERAALRLELAQALDGQASTHTQLLELQAAHSAQSFESESARSELTSALGEQQTLQAELTNALNEQEALRAELASALSEQETLRAELASILGERERLRGDSSNALGEQEALRAELASSAELQQSLQGALASAETERAALETTNAELSQQLALLSSELDTMRRELVSSAEEFKSSRSRLTGALAERDASRAESERVSGELERMNAERERISGELERVTGELESALEGSNAAREQLETLQAQLAGERAERVALHTQNDAARGELEGARAEIESLKAQMDEALAALEASREELAAAEANSASMTELVQLQAQLDDALAQVERSTAELEQLQRRLAESEQAAADAQEARVQFKRFHSELSEGMKRLESENSALLSQIATLEHGVKSREALENQERARAERLKVLADELKRVLEQEPLEGGISTKPISVTYPGQSGTMPRIKPPGTPTSF